MCTVMTFVQGGADMSTDLSSITPFPFTLNFFCAPSSPSSEPLSSSCSGQRVQQLPAAVQDRDDLISDLNAAAPCHPFILNLPKQYEQRQRGAGGFSGGAHQELQRQGPRHGTKEEDQDFTVPQQFQFGELRLFISIVIHFFVEGFHKVVRCRETEVK